MATATLSKAKAKVTDPRFEQLAVKLLKTEGIELGRMFGSEGLKVCGKVFAMCVNGELVVKLPADRVAALVQAKEAKLFDPGHGRPMKEWLSMSAGSAETWLSLAKESQAYVASLEAKKIK